MVQEETVVELLDHSDQFSDDFLVVSQVHSHSEIQANLLIVFGLLLQDLFDHLQVFQIDYFSHHLHVAKL